MTCLFLEVLAVAQPRTRAAAAESGGARRQLTRTLLDRMVAEPSRRDELAEEVVRLNMAVARDVARRYDGRGIAIEDLQQVAYLGLVKAVQHYDPDKATDFLSFAVPTIRGEVRRWFRDAGWVVRPPRSVQERQARVASAQQDLWQDLGRLPTPEEIASALDDDPAAVRDALAARGCFAPSSLDAPARGVDGGSDVGERLGECDSGYARIEARVALKPLLGELTPRERRILELRFVTGATQAEIGADIGVTQMQVSRLLTGIFARLRTQLEGGEPDVTPGT